MQKHERRHNYVFIWDSQLDYYVESDYFTDMYQSENTKLTEAVVGEVAPDNDRKNDSTVPDNIRRQ